MALFILGDFLSCITDVKYQLYEDLDVPIIVTGGPECEAVPYAYAYIGGIGRRAKGFHRESEFAILDNIVGMISKALDERREELEKDPLSVSPFRLMDEITQQIPEVGESLSPTPITMHLDGMRIKLPYDEYYEKIRNVKFIEGPTLSDVAEVRPSFMREYLVLTIKTRSVAGFAL